MSVKKSHEKGRTASVGSDAWFAVLDAADSALHNLQYPLREMELPEYPAGGTCGCHNLGIILRGITNAQMAIRDLEKQLREYQHLSKSYGPSANKPDEERPAGRNS